MYHEKACRIAVLLGATINAPEGELAEARDWTIRKLLRLKEVFGPRLEWLV
jgi:hypothetical protein